MMFGLFWARTSLKFSLEAFHSNSNIKNKVNETFGNMLRFKLNCAVFGGVGQTVTVELKVTRQSVSEQQDNLSKLPMKPEKKKT
jgi:hypothetical protein